MASAATSTPTRSSRSTEELEPHGVLGHSARRESLAFALPAPGRYLAIEDGEVMLTVALHQDVTHVGRGFSADLRLEDQSVSRRHAVIVDDGDGRADPRRPQRQRGRSSTVCASTMCNCTTATSSSSVASHWFFEP